MHKKVHHKQGFGFWADSSVLWCEQRDCGNSLKDRTSAGGETKKHLLPYRTSVLGNLPEFTLAKWWSGSIFNKLWCFWLRWSLMPKPVWPLFLDQTAGVLLKHKTNFSRIKKRITKMSRVSENAVDKKRLKILTVCYFLTVTCITSCSYKTSFNRVKKNMRWTY